jgi:hypothetical protein
MRAIWITPCAALLALGASCGDEPDSTEVTDASALTADADPNAPDADPSAPDADPNAPDADPSAPDAAGSGGDPDAAGGGGGGEIACGDTTCTGGQICCVTTGGPGGFTSECTAADACKGNPVTCDGPEDCGDGVCCGSFGDGGGGAACESADTCMTVICHDDGDCLGEGETCCSFLGSSVCSTFCF